MARPSLFIGSSKEGLELAGAVRSKLETDAEVTLWADDFFRPGLNYVDSLINSLSRFDFAVLVLRPEDFVVSRHVESFGPRDNILFELGLFMGRIGKERTFMLHESGAAIKLPSDLAGVATATYQIRDDGNHIAAVGTACDVIRKIIRELGVSEAKVAKELSVIRSRQQQHEFQISSQEKETRALKVALQGIVTQFEYDKLVGLDGAAPFFCWYSDDLYNELKRLRAMLLIRNYDKVGLASQAGA